MKSAPSNTIIINNLTPIFFHPILQSILRSQFNKYDIKNKPKWINLQTLNKIIIIYKNSNIAKKVKEEINEIIFEEDEIIKIIKSLIEINNQNQNNKNIDSYYLKNQKRTLIKLYFGPKIQFSDEQVIIEEEEETNNKEINNYFLKPPEFDKNFLISPPGSPPVGWEQIIEDAPNQKVLADDLIQRLRFLSVDTQDIQNNNNNEQEIKDLNNKEIILVNNSLLPTLKVIQIPTLEIPSLNNNYNKINFVKSTFNKISPTPMPQI